MNLSKEAKELLQRLKNDSNGLPIQGNLPVGAQELISQGLARIDENGSDREKGPVLKALPTCWRAETLCSNK